MKLPKRLYFVIFIFILFIRFPLVAQYSTSISIQMNSQNFAEHIEKVGGVTSKHLYVKVVEFVFDDGSVVNLSLSSLKTYSISIPVSSKTIKYKIRIIAHHYVWMDVTDTDITYDFSDAVNIDDVATQVSKSNTFEGWPESVSWNMSYSIQVNPFPPIITAVDGKQCLPFTMNADSNTPSFFNNNGSTYTWQYGQMTEDLVANPDFQNFLMYLSGALEYYNQQCSSNCPCMNCINSAIMGTDYSFLKDYLDLYDNIEVYSENKESLANYMLDAIETQFSLQVADQSFLNYYFLTAFTSSTTYPPPYIYLKSIKWQPSALNGLSIVIDKGFIPVVIDYTTLYFRVQATRNLVSGSFSDEISADILPSAPKADQLDTSLFKSSCPDLKPTGQITILNVSSDVPNATYTYRITPIDFPDIINIEADQKTQNIKWGDEDVPFPGNNVTINNIKPGGHKLYISYYDPSIKNCLSPETFIIDSLPKLDFTVKADSTSCPEKNNGKISITVNQSAGTPTYYLFGNPINTNIIDTLSAGDKTVSVTDGCVTNPNERIQNKSIFTPLAVQINRLTISPSQPNCFDPANGGWSMDATGGSNKFDYLVYQSGQFPSDSLTKEYGIVSTWNTHQLPDGDYIINLRDSKHPYCFGDTVHRTLNPVTPLSVSISNITDVLCFGQNKGSVKLSASGGTNDYQFQFNGITVSAVKDQLVTFDSLYAVEYTLQVKNSVATCNDVTTQTISIGTNPEVKMQLFPIDITCNGDHNGQIRAVLTGGSTHFDWHWYEKYGNGWDQLNNKEDSLSISAMIAGNYRLAAWDDVNHCDTIYSSTTIHEPLPLAFDTVILHDIPCLGDTGSVDMKASGGNGDNTNYKYQYSTNNQNWERYTPGTSLDTATYYLRVVDIKNCTTYYPDPQTITVPPSKFDFSDTISNFNGFQVTCFGNNNAWIKIVPTGGNGANYSGYQCTVNGTWHSTDSLLSNLFAGNYNLSVRDGRGCTITRPVKLTQPVSELSIVPSQQNPICYIDTTGIISLLAGGGASPYTYRIGTSSYDTARIFRHLSGGTYTVTAKDVNGCTQVMDIDLASKSPQITISGTVDNVKCFGQKGGSIIPAISGGITPYAWLWKDKTDNQFEQHYLVKGTYTLNIIDGLNCEASQQFQISEPTLLNISATSKPVCVDAASGFIYPKANGGTPPYQYSVSQSSGFTPNAELPVGAGTYNVYAADSNKCIASTQATVETRNTKPWVDFLVATSRYALDSLIVIDVSWPTPDSIKWTFPAEANVLGYNPSPIIKFDQAGSYQVTMTGYFSGCDYAMTQPLNIAPYDPDIFITDKSKIGIETVNIIPNPNSGLFKVGYKVHPKQIVNFKVVDMYGKLWYTNMLPSAMEGEISVQMPTAPPGSYILTVISENDAKSMGFIITK